MDAKKVAIIILVLLGVLFVVVLAMSSDKQKDRRPIDTSSWKALLHKFVTTRSVLPRELGGRDFVIRANDKFVATIPEAKDVYVRELHLKMTRGSVIEIELDPQPKADYGPLKGELKTDSSTLSLPVFQGRALLSATCTSADPFFKTCGFQLTN
jgi:hypothetical protein